MADKPRCTPLPRLLRQDSLYPLNYKMNRTPPTALLPVRYLVIATKDATITDLGPFVYTPLSSLYRMTRTLINFKKLSINNEWAQLVTQLEKPS